MTDNELSILMYLEKYVKTVNNQNVLQHVEIITHHIRNIIEAKEYNNSGGNCDLCGMFTKSLRQDKFCRLCYDQFIA